MNAKAAIFSFSLYLVIFLLVAETTLARPKGFDVDRDYARRKMSLPGHENPEAISEMVERQSPAMLIVRDLQFYFDPCATFKISEGGRLQILRVDYDPSLPLDETKVLKLADENEHPVNPEYTTSDNIHFDFRFDNKPLKVSAGQKFKLCNKAEFNVPFRVDVYGYYAN